MSGTDSGCQRPTRDYSALLDLISVPRLLWVGWWGTWDLHGAGGGRVRSPMKPLTSPIRNQKLIGASFFWGGGEGHVSYQPLKLKTCNGLGQALTIPYMSTYLPAIPDTETVDTVHLSALDA